VITLFNVAAASLTPLCRLTWVNQTLAALQPPAPQETTDIRAYFLGDQNGVVITTGKCFLLAVHKGASGGCKVKVQRLTSSDASVITAGSTLSGGGGSPVSDDGGGSVVMVPASASSAAAPLAPLAGRLFKRSSVLGRVSWTLQLMSLDARVLTYTNKDGKCKAYDLTDCTVTTPQVNRKTNQNHNPVCFHILFLSPATRRAIQRRFFCSCPTARSATSRCTLRATTKQVPALLGFALARRVV
jgi:hypothetical protein